MLRIFHKSSYILKIVDCKPGGWGAWTECSATCGNSTTTRIRPVEEQPKGEGAKCNGDLKLKDTKDCPSKEECPGEITS